jgi:hypothetical protein
MAEIHGRLEDETGRPVTGAPIVSVDEFTEADLPPLDASLGVRLAVTDLLGDFQSRPLIVGSWAARALGGKSLVDAQMRGNSPAEGWNLRETMVGAGSLRGVISTHGAVSENLCVRALPVEYTRSPVPFACRADGRVGKVLRNGAFAIDGLAPGVLYELRAGVASHAFEDESLWSPPVFADWSVEDLRVRWEADATVSFALVDAADRSAVATCEVELEGALPSITVPDAPLPGRGGVRFLEGVRPLRPFPGASLHASSRGYVPVVQRLDLRPGKDTSLATLPMSRLPTLEVRVVDALTGAPISGALVTATDVLFGRDPSDSAPAAVATDSAGRARLSSFVGADSQIGVCAAGHARQRRIGPFGGGFSSPRLEFRLTRGATARIRVVDTAGVAVSGARIEWIEGNWSPNDPSPGRDRLRVLDRPDAQTSRIADSDGLVAFHHLAPGRHAFRVQRWSGNLDGEWTQRELVEGEEADIELHGPSRSTLELRINDAGVPFAGTRVLLMHRSSVGSLLGIADLENPLPPGIDARTDTAGAHAFANLDPGVYVLAFAVPGQRSRGCREVRIREGQNLLTLDLASTALSGRVGKGENHPIAGARILLADPTGDRDLRETFRRHGSSLSTAAAAFGYGLEHEAAVADENGEFRLLGLPLTEPIVLLAVEDPSGFGKSEPIVLREDSGPTQADLSILPAGALEIHANDPLAVAPLLVLAIPRDRRAVPRIRRVFPGRSEVLGGLEPGTWELQLAEGSARAKDRQRVEVVAGETQTVEWSLP